MKLITYSVDLFEMESQINRRWDLQDELEGRAHQEGVESDFNVDISSLYRLNSTVRLNTNVNLVLSTRLIKTKFLF